MDTFDLQLRCSGAVGLVRATSGLVLRFAATATEYMSETGQCCTTAAAVCVDHMRASPVRSDKCSNFSCSLVLKNNALRATGHNYGTMLLLNITSTGSDGDTLRAGGESHLQDTVDLLQHLRSELWQHLQRTEIVLKLLRKTRIKSVDPPERAQTSCLEQWRAGDGAGR